VCYRLAGLPIRTLTCFLTALAFASSSAVVHAEGRLFGLVAKSRDDPNFIDAWRGCASVAEARGDSCVLLGAPGEAQARLQAQQVQQAVGSHRFDALAISVMNSRMVRNALNLTGIPVITFDSPFDTANETAQRSYVGIDNMAFGVQLGRAAKALRPGGGTLCLMSAAHDTNLAERVHGVRRALSGDARWPAGKRLTGEGGWTEAPRCPVQTGDSIPRTMTELNLILGHISADALVSVGHWPVVDTPAYRNAIKPYETKLKARKQVVVVGIGRPTDAITGLIDEGLLHAYVSIDFSEMGRATARVMGQLVAGETVPAQVISPVTVRIATPPPQ